jgi:hypothetical protein
MELIGPPPLASFAYDLNGNRIRKTLENSTSTGSTLNTQCFSIYDSFTKFMGLCSAPPTPRSFEGIPEKPPDPSTLLRMTARGGCSIKQCLLIRDFVMQGFKARFSRVSPWILKNKELKDC